jgi:hypothetical protein
MGRAGDGVERVLSGRLMTDHERTAIAEEATSLPIHVQMCALRHREIRREVAEVRRLMWIIAPASLTAAGGTVAPYLPQILGVLRAAAGQ